MIAVGLSVALLLYIATAWATVRAVGWVVDVCVFPPPTKRILQVLCALIFLLTPTWDIIPSRMYFQRLCEEEAGVKVLKRVTVDRSYFRSDGRPDDRKLLDRYAQSSNWTRDISTWAHVTKIVGTIQDKQTGESLGTATDFVYYGGWIAARIDPMSSITCPQYPNHGIHTAIWQEIFQSEQLTERR